MKPWEHGLHLTGGARVALRLEPNPNLLILYCESLTASSGLQSKQTSTLELVSELVYLQCGQLSYNPSQSFCSWHVNDIGRMTPSCGTTRAPKSPRNEEIYEQFEALSWDSVSGWYGCMEPNFTIAMGWLPPQEECNSVWITSLCVILAYHQLERGAVRQLGALFVWHKNELTRFIQ